MAAQAKASHLSSSEASSFLISKRAHWPTLSRQDRTGKWKGVLLFCQPAMQDTTTKGKLLFINYCYFPYILKSVILIFSVFILVVEEVE